MALSPESLTEERNSSLGRQQHPVGQGMGLNKQKARSTSHQLLIPDCPARLGTASHPCCYGFPTTKTNKPPSSSQLCHAQQKSN